MIILRKIYGFIQPYIVTVFSVLLFTSFAMVGLVFNFTVNQYIRSGATVALSEAKTHIVSTEYGMFLLHTNQWEETFMPGAVMRILQGSHRFSAANVRGFTINENFELGELWLAADAISISERLRAMRPSMEHTNAFRLRTSYQTFYVSMFPQEFLMEAANSGSTHIVLYLDVTEILTFTAVVNRLLLASVAMIWLASMIIAHLLAHSMMRPLRVLRDFVHQIGSGNFKQNNNSFANDEFNKLNQTLNAAARQLAAYDHEQKLFFQSVSHELRTPLTTIQMYAEGLKQGIMDRETVSKFILDATHRLTDLVEDILYISRIDSIAPPEMLQANMCTIVQERIIQHKPLAKLMGVEIKFVSDGAPILVNCVASYIERALDNLINNAIRYATETILVECYSFGNTATIRVTDDGSGFLPDEIPHVFERFYRGKDGLTGIGLATVKSITDKHGGTATAENGKEKGAILTISLPRKQ